MLALLVASFVVAAEPDAAAVRPKLAVLELAAGSGVDEKLTAPLTEAITSEVQRRGYFEVLSQRDIATMLGLERQRQLLGCAEDASSCLSELSGALGARFVLSGTLTRLGDAWQLTLNTLDTNKAQPLGRATRLARDLPTLHAQLPWAVAEATATPAPAPPSKVLPYTLIGVGATAAVVGLLLGMVALNNQGQISGELDSGATRAGVLKTRADYERALSETERNKYIAASCLGSGVALAVLGFFLMPEDVGGASVALVPTGTGAALAGVFP